MNDQEKVPKGQRKTCMSKLVSKYFPIHYLPVIPPVMANIGSIRALMCKKSHVTLFPQKIVKKHCLFLEHSKCC